MVFMIEMLALTSVAHMNQVMWVKKVIAKLCNFKIVIYFGSLFASPLCMEVSMHISPILATWLYLIVILHTNLFSFLKGANNSALVTNSGLCE